MDQNSSSPTDAAVPDSQPSPTPLPTTQIGDSVAVSGRVRRMRRRGSRRSRKLGRRTKRIKRIDPKEADVDAGEDVETSDTDEEEEQGRCLNINSKAKSSNLIAKSSNLKSGGIKTQIKTVFVEKDLSKKRKQ